MGRSSSPSGGEALFVSHLALIERVSVHVCRRHHLRADDAEDFSSHVKVKVLEDDCAILRKFQGRSSLQTYLSVVVQRLFLDYRISAWGKWRPSAEAKRLGAVGMLLEQLTTRDGYSVDQACEVMRTNHQVEATRAELERMAERLPPRTPRRFEGDAVLLDVPSLDPPADQLLGAGQAAASGAVIGDALRRAMAGLDVQDRLVLTLRFEDGRTVAEIATMLRLDQKALYRRIERLLKELRTSLEQAGVERARVLEMLESPAVSTVEGGRDTTSETLEVGPSMSPRARS